MTKKWSGFRKASFLLVVLLWGSCALVQLGQEKKDKEEKKPDPTTPPASQDTQKKETIEYDEVRSPFGIQRVPRKAGGSPFQQPTLPATPPSTAPPAKTDTPPTATTPAGLQAPTPVQPPVAVAPAAGQATPPVAASPAPQGAAAAAAEAAPGFVCVNCDLLEFIRNVGAELKLNYIIDPKVKGVVTIHTYGELKREDLLPILETVLRINGAAMVKTGNFYQIVMSAGARQLPLEVRKPGELGDLKSDSKVLQIVPMKFVGAADMVKIIEPYMSEGGHVAYHAQGNILLITENSANLRKLMELIDLFDTDVFLNKRVQLYQIKHTRAKDLLPDLERVFSTYAMSKDSAIKFIAIERLNGLLAVAPNPSVASEVEKWILRLDQPVQNIGVRNFVYKIENSEAKKLETVLLKLYGHQAGGLAAGQTGSAMPGAPPPATAATTAGAANSPRA